MDMRTKLLDRAEELARSRGYDAFSFADLATHAQIAKPSVHHHFPTKARLAEALITRYNERVADLLDEIVDTSPNARVCLERFVGMYRDTAQDGASLCLCVAFSASRDRFEADVLDALEAHYDGLLGWLRAAFKAHGWTQSEAEGCLAMCEGAQLMARAARDIEKFDAATKPFLKRLATPND